IGTQFIESNFTQSLALSSSPKWRIVEDISDTAFFEVFQIFQPFLKGDDQQLQLSQKNKLKNDGLNGYNQLYIFIGMGVRPFEDAMSRDLKHNIVMGLIIFFLGMAGFVSLFWAQNYTRSRKLLLDIRAFASEIVANLPVGIVASNSDYKITYINDVACALLGTKQKEAKGRPSNKILPNYIWKLHELIKKKQDVVEKKVTLISDNNKPLPVAVSATNIIDANQNFVGYLFVLKDLSEIRQLEIKTQRIEKLAAIGSLAAGIAHEVRNPLSSIKGYVTFFGSLFESGSENRKAAKLMAEEVDRVNRVISELLEFARPSDLKLKKTDMHALINHSIKIVAHEAESSGIRIVKDIPSDLPEIMADPDRLLQVLLNLYINAIQAIKGEGQLKIRIKHNNIRVRINIYDTGIGIPLQDRQKIFDPYYTTKKNGTGLGLAIAHKIIEDHDGAISVKSQENKGTTFIIYLPVKTSYKRES
ncbi:MAG: ATP-binding protein, partial [Desulfobacula sp.]|nr:ATP-binding protein [Desulfobacula sp.]